MMSSVILGNPNPIHHYADGPRPAEHLTISETRVELWEGVHDPEFVELTLSTDNDRRLADLAKALGDEHRQYAVAVYEIEHLLAVHSAGQKPAWVTSMDQALTQAIAAYYGIPPGQPTALLVSAGRDAIHQQMMTTATQPAAFNYLALTASTTAPAITDTTLTGEITTAGGGLIRGQATFAHTTGTNTSTLTKTFTANGSDVLPVTLAQLGAFNASSGGTMFVHTALSGTATLSVAGDNLTTTDTVTAG